MAYRVGALLYVPATNEGISAKMLRNEIAGLSSVAFCLEDAISDAMLESAEGQLMKSLAALSSVDADLQNLPMTFVRIRDPKHLESIARKLSSNGLSISGFVLPKFDSSNAEEYIAKAQEADGVWRDGMRLMPILESGAIASPVLRMAELVRIKGVLDKHRNAILNVRVGGNDLCNFYRLRRTFTQNIYQIGVVRDALLDILAVFAKDYIVSGPVWEYFGTSDDKSWREGLEAELELDKLNGFIGKTAIHPCQIPVINKALMVSKEDFEDAQGILSWSSEDAVSRSNSGNRMDEIKTHKRWAQRVMDLAEIYGVNNG